MPGDRPPATTVLNDFGYIAGGWRVEKHVRLVGDVSGDKTGDLVGFGDSGVLVAFNRGNNTFTGVKLVLGDFGYNAGGWRVEKHLRYLCDIRNVGRCDIVGFGDGGVLVSRNDGNANFKPVYIALNDFGYDAGGWRLERHLRFLGDTTGDGLADIVGFGEQNVFIGRNKGNGTFEPAKAVINDFCYSAGGWRVEEHPRFIADLTNDRTHDIIGCGAAGVFVSLNKGNQGFGPVHRVVDNFGTNQGWRVDQHPRYIADLTGDGCGDIVGFGHAGVWVSYNNGDGTFRPAELILRNFGVEQGWQVSKHPRFLVDLTGDGCAEIIGFGETSVWVALNDGSGRFGEPIPLVNTFAFNNGDWAMDKTVRWLTNLTQNR